MIPKRLQKEVYVIVHGQTARFRIIKWIIILIILGMLFAWKGWSVVIWTVMAAAVLGISLHMFFRYKTEAWTKPWGKLKSIKTPYDQ